MAGDAKAGISFEWPIALAIMTDDSDDLERTVSVDGGHATVELAGCDAGIFGERKLVKERVRVGSWNKLQETMPR